MSDVIQMWTGVNKDVRKTQTFKSDDVLSLTFDQRDLCFVGQIRLLQIP